MEDERIRAARAKRAFMAGGVAAAVWAATEQLATKRPVRVGGLLTLAVVGIGGMITASPKAANVEKRLNDMLNNGAHFNSDVHVGGDHNVHGAVNMTGSNGMNLNGNNVNMSGGNVSSIGSIGGGSNKVLVNEGFNMSNNDINSIGRVGPWNGNSAGLVGDSGATTVAGLRDYVNGQFGRLRNTGIG